MPATTRKRLKNPAADSNRAKRTWLVGGGEMGELIRSMDWSSTPLGPLESWPDSLRTTVNLSLSSNFPINIVWGGAYNQIYNDGYRVIVAEKHPAAMGMPYDKCWESAWPQIGKPFERAWAGETSFLENQRMFLTRNAYLEETCFTFSLSPIRDASGIIVGLFHPVTETTATMLSERRTRALRELAANTGEARSLETAFTLSARTFAVHEFDLPFVLLYALNAAGTEARLIDATGIAPDLQVSPRFIPLSASEPWRLSEIVAGDSLFEFNDLQDRFGAFRCGPYPEGVHSAVARPLRVAGIDAPLGVIIAGISPRLPFNQEYRDHIEQVMRATATALGNALAYEREKNRAEALAELDRSKTEFFSNISHEFRTPLTLMLGPLEDALSTENDLSAQLKERIDVAHRNSLRLLRLVNSLLDFSRIEAGRARAVYEPKDLSAFTAQLAANFHSAVERAGLRLTVDCPPLPKPVYVDSEMWEKIVLNLLSNAFKFTLQGEIAIRLGVLQDGVELTVSDTGTGIPGDELPHIFERFHRVRGAQGRTHEGSGIGLALVQELVKLHAGTIRVESKLGKGTTFHICLPFGREHLPPDQVNAPRQLATTATRAEAYIEEALRWLPDGAPVQPEANGNRATAIPSEQTSTEPSETVLVVDDNADMRDYVSRLLEPVYFVLTAADGAEALRVISAHRPDLVLTDVMMPVLDGFGLLNAIRSNAGTRTLPVILLSARAGEESRSEGMDAGADDYLIKPFSARELLARVSAHVKLARVRKDAGEQIRESEARLRAFVAASSDALYRMNRDWTEMLSLEGGTLMGTKNPRDSWLDEYIPEKARAEVDQRIQEAIRTKSPFELEHQVRRADGTIGWTHSHAVPVFDDRGEIVEWFGAATDVTTRRQAEQDLRASLAEREALLKELHHRVKNNLQVITSLLEMQSRQVHDWEVLNLFEEARNRVASIASIHEMLYRSGSFSKVELLAYTRHLVPYLISFYRADSHITCSIEGTGILLDLERAVPCGLLINELISNVCKHAFPNHQRGNLIVRLDEDAKHMRLTVRDSGIGLPDEFDYRESPTLGLQLVQTLADQLGGTVSFNSERGTKVEVSIPLHR